MRLVQTHWDASACLYGASAILNSQEINPKSYLWHGKNKSQNISQHNNQNTKPHNTNDIKDLIFKFNWCGYFPNKPNISWLFNFQGNLSGTESVGQQVEDSPVWENIEVTRQQVSLLGNFSAISAHRSRSHKYTNSQIQIYTNTQNNTVLFSENVSGSSAYQSHRHAVSVGICVNAELQRCQESWLRAWKDYWDYMGSTFLKPWQ